LSKQNISIIVHFRIAMNYNRSRQLPWDQLLACDGVCVDERDGCPRCSGRLRGFVSSRSVLGVSSSVGARSSMGKVPFWPPATSQTHSPRPPFGHRRRRQTRLSSLQQVGKPQLLPSRSANCSKQPIHVWHLHFRLKSELN